MSKRKKCSKPENSAEPEVQRRNPEKRPAATGSREHEPVKHGTVEAAAIEQLSPQQAAQSIATSFQWLFARMHLHVVWKFGDQGGTHSTPIEPLRDDEVWLKENGGLLARLVTIHALLPKGGPLLDRAASTGALAYDLAVLTEDLVREYLPLLGVRQLVPEEVGAWRELKRRASRMCSRLNHALPNVNCGTITPLQEHGAESLPPLVRDALKYIAEHPKSAGAGIAKSLSISEGHFFNEVSPALRGIGVKSRQPGYVAPPDVVNRYLT